jgi:MbtH protein
MSESEQDQIVYKVVINQEEQYSIWPADREDALGWRDAGKQGQKQECLDYINEVWTDMRPLSLRKQTDKAAGS